MAFPTRPQNHFREFFFQNLVTADPYGAWTIVLVRLRHEKDVLENDLADCVPYLQVLRKRQARNDRLLNFNPLLPRKKRMKMQRSRHEFEKEIRNRERDKQAFLNNLHSCEANMYIAERYTYALTGVSGTWAGYVSSATQCSYEDLEPTEISWKDWNDGLVMPP